MLRVLVVDDEPRQRKVLASIIKKFRPDYELMEAKNGVEALQLAKDHEFHIIFTDIRMPGMDGLKLIEALGTRIKQIKVIIVSVYGYFEYAQKALVLGAHDYILKPFEEVRIQEVMERVEIGIIQDMTDSREKENLLRQLDTSLPVYFNHLMNLLVKNDISHVELLEVKKIFPANGEGVVIFTALSNFVVKGKYTAEEADEVRQNIKYWIRETLACFGHTISFFPDTSGNEMVTILCTGNDPGERTNEVITKLNAFAKDVEAEYGFRVTVGIGQSHGNIFENIHSSYESARIACSCNFYFPELVVIHFSQIRFVENRKIYVRYKEEKTLNENIHSMDKEKSLSTIETIFHRIVSEEFPAPESLIDKMYKILLRQVLSLQNIIEDDVINEIIKSMNTSINHTNCQTIYSLKTFCAECVVEIIEIIVNKKSNRNSVIIKKCMDYIDMYYDKDIMLESIAQELHFNPAYFSIYFKKHTGVNFSEYLTAIRLHKAKELLVHSGKKIYEISNMVGYKDQKYFYKLFKKTFGCTPDEYRRTAQ